MTTATKRRRRSKSTEPRPRSKALLDVPVSYGNVSIGDTFARLAVKIDKQQLNVETAEEFFCGRRLTGLLFVGDDAEGQQVMFHGARPEIDGVFDAKAFRSTPKSIGAGLTFGVNDLDLGVLSKFAKHSGRFTVYDVQGLDDANDDADEGGDAGDNDED